MKIEKITLQLDQEDLELFSKKELLREVKARLFGVERDFTTYLQEAIKRDEERMVMHKEALTGRYDEDIALNRQIQTELKKCIQGNERD